MYPENADAAIEVTGRPSIRLGIIKSPVAWGLLPVIVMALALLENNNSAFEVAVNVSSSARPQALEFFRSCRRMPIFTLMITEA